MPRTIPTAVLDKAVECGDFHAETDNYFKHFTEYAAKYPEDDFTREFKNIAKIYQSAPTAITMAKPAQPEDYTEFGFIEYSVAHPITIAKIAKKKWIRINGMRPKQYFKSNVLRELHRFAVFEPFEGQEDSDALRYLRDEENTPDYESDDEANNRMVPLNLCLTQMFNFA